jgi:hypothetical protein
MLWHCTLLLQYQDKELRLVLLFAHLIAQSFVTNTRHQSDAHEPALSHFNGTAYTLGMLLHHVNHTWIVSLQELTTPGSERLYNARNTRHVSNTVTKTKRKQAI